MSRAVATLDPDSPLPSMVPLLEAGLQQHPPMVVAHVVAIFLDEHFSPEKPMGSTMQLIERPSPIANTPDATVVTIRVVTRKEHSPETLQHWENVIISSGLIKQILAECEEAMREYVDYAALDTHNALALESGTPWVCMQVCPNSIPIVFDPCLPCPRLHICTGCRLHGGVFLTFSSAYQRARTARCCGQQSLWRESLDGRDWTQWHLY